MTSLNQIKEEIAKISGFSDKTKEAAFDIFAKEYYDQFLSSKWLDSQIANELLSFKTESNFYLKNNVSSLLSTFYTKFRMNTSGAVVYEKVFLPNQMFEQLKNEFNLPDDTENITYHGQHICRINGSFDYAISVGYSKFDNIGLRKTVMFGKLYI